MVKNKNKNVVNSKSTREWDTKAKSFITQLEHYDIFNGYIKFSHHMPLPTIELLLLLFKKNINDTQDGVYLFYNFY